MTTPPIELAATVERIERKEPPEPEGTIALYRFPGDDNPWHANDPRSHKLAIEYAEYMAKAKGCDVRLVRITPAPSPAETGAVPVDLIRKAAMALENVGKYGVASDLYAWLATQKGTR